MNDAGIAQRLERKKFPPTGSAPEVAGENPAPRSTLSHTAGLAPCGADERYYCGGEDGHTVTVCAAGQRPHTGLPLDPRSDLADHSPDGFAWGFGGSGPAQLALALLADAFAAVSASRRDADVRALALYQDFKWRVIAALPPRWTLSRTRVLAYAAEIAQRALAGMHFCCEADR